MTTKPTDEEIDASPERFKRLKTGAVYDREAHHIVANSGTGPYQITSATARQMTALRKQKGIRSRYLGMIRGAGLDVDENATDEDIISKAADALEVYVAHLGKTFLKSENLRGMGETFSKLATPFIEEPDEEQTPFAQVRGLVQELAELSRALGNLRSPQQYPRQSADGRGRMV